MLTRISFANRNVKMPIEYVCHSYTLLYVVRENLKPQLEMMGVTKLPASGSEWPHKMGLCASFDFSSTQS